MMRWPGFRSSRRRRRALTVGKACLSRAKFEADDDDMSASRRYDAVSRSGISAYAPNVEKKWIKSQADPHRTEGSWPADESRCIRRRGRSRGISVRTRQGGD